MKDNIKPEGSHYDILLVDDDLATLKLLTMYFESKDITCRGVVNGTKALEELEYNTPKLILTDITHPGPSGYDICKQIKSNPKLKHIPVFFCTAKPYFWVEKHLAETKADGYILKPFHFSDFDGILELLRSKSVKEVEIQRTPLLESPKEKKKRIGTYSKSHFESKRNRLKALSRIEKLEDNRSDQNIMDYLQQKNSITPRLTEEEIDKLGIVKDNVKPEGSHYDIRNDEFRKEREWLKIQFGEYNLDYIRLLKPIEIIKRSYPKERYFPTAEKQINQYITVKLVKGKTYIYVNGKKFIQCIRLILNIEKEEIPIYDEIESIDEVVKVYENHIYQNRIVQGPMAAPVRDQNYNITPEQEFWGHCSNLQAWVENDYDTRILMGNLSFPLLRELTRVGDPIAKRVYKEEIALRLESGYSSTVQYLLNQGYINIFTPSEFKSILEATDIIKNLSSSPGVLNQFLRSCFHRFPTLIDDILLQILRLQDGKKIISSIIQKDRDLYARDRQEHLKNLEEIIYIIYLYSFLEKST